MYHSVTFGSMNTFSDWHLVPDSRPVIAMPEPKKVTVDVPGSNGILDLSETLTKYPIYSNRSGSLVFNVLNNIEDWSVLYHRIANYLHGKRMRMVLEDDPDYYYMGRYTVVWGSPNDGTWSQVGVDYDLDPYKYYKYNSIEEAPDLYSNINVSGTVIKTLSGLDNVGEVPVVPEFTFTNISGQFTTTLNNSELSISNLSKQISVNGTRKYHDIILSNMTSNNNLRLSFSGNGRVTVLFRRMAL